MDQHGRTRRWIVTSALVAGTVLGGAGIASAATDNSSSSTSSTGAAATGTAATAQAPAQGQDPSTLTNGPGETLLTGTVADSVTAAAKAAIPDGTIIRVETDNEGAAYEAHVKKSDGTIVTLKFDTSFKVTSTIDGFGAAPAGGQAPSGAPASGSSSSTSGAAA